MRTECIECADNIASTWAKGIIFETLVLEAIQGTLGVRVWVRVVVRALPSHGWH